MERQRAKKSPYYYELINATDYANIYGLYTHNGEPIGTKEVRLAGRDVGTYCYSLKSCYNKTDIRRMFGRAERR